MIASEIKALRVKLGLSQLEFAKKIYSSQSSIPKYEKGRVKPTAATMAHIEALAGKSE